MRRLKIFLRRRVVFFMASSRIHRIMVAPLGMMYQSTVLGHMPDNVQPDMEKMTNTLISVIPASVKLVALSLFLSYSEESGTERVKKFCGCAMGIRALSIISLKIKTCLTRTFSTKIKNQFKNMLTLHSICLSNLIKMWHTK